MARRSTSTKKKAYGDPVFTWAFRSSQARGGQIINYETRLEEDGVLRCNCPGWVFCKTKDANGNPVAKACTHTRQVKDESTDILKKFRRGEALPVFEDPDAPRTGANAANPNADHSKIKYGRLIEF